MFFFSSPRRWRRQVNNGQDRQALQAGGLNSHLPNGVYLYRLTTESEVVINKFVLAR